MNIQKTKAFTLVELIVVITILAILGTIAFISLQGYSADSRDSVRISDMASIKSGLELFQLDAGKYPLPSDQTSITYSGAIAWTQGYFGEQTKNNISKLDKIPTDPLTDAKYVYSTTNTRNEYQLAGVMESDTVSLNISNGTYAASKTAVLKVAGNYNGKLLKVSTGGIDYILSLPSIISSSGTIVDNIVANSYLAYNGYKNLPFQYSGGRYNTLGDLGKNFVNNNSLVAFSGNSSTLLQQDEQGSNARTAFLIKLQNAYTGTAIKNEGQIIQILAADSTNINLIGSTLINNTLGGKIDISKTQTVCVDSQTPTAESYFTFDSSTQTITAYNTAGGTDIVIPCTINGVSVKNIGIGAFNNKGLTTVVIPNSVISIGINSFLNNPLTSVTNYDGMVSTEYVYSPNGSGIKIDRYLGTNTSVTIPSTLNGKTVNAIWYNAFKNKGLTNLVIPNTVTSIQNSAFSSNSISTVIIPTSLTSLGANAFINNPLTSVTNYDGVVSAEYVYGPYGNGVELNQYIGTATSLTIPNSFNGKSVNSIGNSVFINKGLTSVVIPSTVTNIGISAFYGNSLTSISLPTGLTDIGSNAFYGNSLSSLTLPNSVVTIGINAFIANAITSLVIPDSVTTIGNSAFDSNQISSLTIGNSVASIGNSSFHGNQLTTVTIPNSVTTILDAAFDTNSITSVTIGNGVTSLSNYVFAHNLITSVIIPNTISSIGMGVFLDNSLTSVTIPSSVTSIQDSAFNSQTNSAGGGTIYGPASGYIFDTYTNNTLNQFDKVKLPNYVVQ